MDEARLIRRTSFRASHHYGLAGRPEEASRKAFGAQAAPHVHDWTVEVRVCGPLDPETGFVTDLGALDDALAALVGAWSDGDLNALVPEVASDDLNPSTESLARWIFERLASRIASPARLERVAVFESRELGAEYPA
jgi:6-pyruvoyltetrahydropterin/6-carboxytetrahydropterin synthase